MSSHSLAFLPMTGKEVRRDGDDEGHANATATESTAANWLRPSAECSYGEAEYWNRRYQGEEAADCRFDWYQKYEELKPYVEQYVRREDRVLMIGCGNSAMSEDMIADGYQDIHSIDISEPLIASLQQKHGSIGKMKFTCMDACDLSFFQDQQFHCVIDKGTLDAILCGGDSYANAALALSETCRVLKEGGVFVLVTYGDPHLRLPVLKTPELPWSLSLHVIPRPGSITSPVPSSKLSTFLQAIPLPAMSGSIKIEGHTDWHFIYVCRKDSTTNLKTPSLTLSSNSP